LPSGVRFAWISARKFSRFTALAEKRLEIAPKRSRGMSHVTNVPSPRGAMQRHRTAWAAVRIARAASRASAVPLALRGHLARVV
jgi:hypothetical protein